MNELEDGGPAYPARVSVNRDTGELQPFQFSNDGFEVMGMSLRDYFAAKAMQAMISKSNGQDMTGGKNGVPIVSQFAYEYADAMLEARKQ